MLRKLVGKCVLKASKCMVALSYHQRGLRVAGKSTEDYWLEWCGDHIDFPEDDDSWDDEPMPLPSDPHLEKLGLSCHAGGFQTGVGYFATKLTESPAATAILELLKDALNERGVPIKFNQIRHSRGPGGHDPDPSSLVMSVGEHNIKIAVRINNEGNDRQFCGFVPEETSGGFGIMIFVQKGDYDYYFKEISCATHYADPSFDPEVAVDEIEKIINGLKGN